MCLVDIHAQRQNNEPTCMKQTNRKEYRNIGAKESRCQESPSYHSNPSGRPLPCRDLRHPHTRAPEPVALAPTMRQSLPSPGPRMWRRSSTSSARRPSARAGPQTATSPTRTRTGNPGPSGGWGRWRGGGAAGGCGRPCGGGRPTCTRCRGGGPAPSGKCRRRALAASLLATLLLISSNRALTTLSALLPPGSDVPVLFPAERLVGRHGTRHAVWPRLHPDEHLTSERPFHVRCCRQDGKSPRAAWGRILGSARGVYSRGGDLDGADPRLWLQSYARCRE